MAPANVSNVVETMDAISTDNEKNPLATVPDKPFVIVCINLQRGGTETQISYLSTLPSCKKIICLEEAVSFFDTSHLSLVTLSKHTKHTSAIVKWLYLPWLVFKLKRELSKTGIETVVSFLDKPNLVNIFTALLRRQRTIICIRTDIIEFYKGSLVKRWFLGLLTTLYRKADKIIFNSLHAAKRFAAEAKIVEEKIKVIGNGFPVAAIREKAAVPLPAELDALFRKKKVIVAVGNTHIFKGYWYLLRIFKSVKNKLPGTALLIVGDGNMFDDLIALAHTLELKEYNAKTQNGLTHDCDVYFLGQQHNPYPFIQRASLYVLTSILEGSPNVLNEAIICNQFVMAANCKSGPKEIIAPQLHHHSPVANPYTTERGILMPAFDGALQLNDSDLSKEEVMWVNTIVTQLQQPVVTASAPGNDEYVQSLEQQQILTQWQLVINGRN